MQTGMLQQPVFQTAPLQWLGWIKDYDGGTLMECRLSGRIPYIAVPNMLKCVPARGSWPCHR